MRASGMEISGWKILSVVVHCNNILCIELSTLRVMTALELNKDHLSDIVKLVFL